jgi:hypothetical protein
VEQSKDVIGKSDSDTRRTHRKLNGRADLEIESSSTLMTYSTILEAFCVDFIRVSIHSGEVLSNVWTSKVCVGTQRSAKVSCRESREGFIARKLAGKRREAPL